MVSTDEMMKLSNSNSLKELGLFTLDAKIKTNSKNGKSSVVSEDYDIYVLYGLPYRKFCTTVVHELAHDWVIEYVSTNLKPEINEGF